MEDLNREEKELIKNYRQAVPKDRDHLRWYAEIAARAALLAVMAISST